VSGWLAVFALIAVFGLGMVTTLALQTLEAAHKDRHVEDSE
jgi:hypothetical protein